jgi:hypothetical protein
MDLRSKYKKTLARIADLPEKQRIRAEDLFLLIKELKGESNRPATVKGDKKASEALSRFKTYMQNQQKG